MPSEVRIISTKELENMHTGSLMSRRKNLLACEQSFEVSDRYGSEKEPIPEETGYIEFKNSVAWQKAYKELKSVLSTREHYGENK
ncbi:MAG TPA: hypothetical protein ENI76_00020 [Ignavibacteria bacterium]|nr:hypothetical protein [Ignavibacteria bacterium]